LIEFNQVIEAIGKDIHMPKKKNVDSTDEKNLMVTPTESIYMDNSVFQCQSSDSRNKNTAYNHQSVGVGEMTVNVIDKIQLE